MSTSLRIETGLSLFKKYNIHNGIYKVPYLCRCTAMRYLFPYPLKVTENLLTHTGMSLNEFACAAGFEYDNSLLKKA